jgi:hypothetical protein
MPSTTCDAQIRACDDASRAGAVGGARSGASGPASSWADPRPGSGALTGRGSCSWWRPAALPQPASRRCTARDRPTGSASDTPGTARPDPGRALRAGLATLPALARERRQWRWGWHSRRRCGSHRAGSDCRSSMLRSAQGQPGAAGGTHSPRWGNRGQPSFNPSEAPHGHYDRPSGSRRGRGARGRAQRFAPRRPRAHAITPRAR